MAQVPECIVCLQPYDDVLHVPRVLACGHSFCELCLMQLQSAWRPASSSLLANNSFDDDSPARPASGAVIRCPECSHRTRLPIGGQQSLPKNVELLRLLPSLVRDPVSSPPEVVKQSPASLKRPAKKTGTESSRAPPPCPSAGRRDSLNVAVEGGAWGTGSGDGSRRPQKPDVQSTDYPNRSLGSLSATSTSNRNCSTVVDSLLLPCNLYSDEYSSNSRRRKDLRTLILPEKAIQLRTVGREDSHLSSSTLRVVDSTLQTGDPLWGEIVLEQDRLSSSVSVRLRELREVKCLAHTQMDDETSTRTYEDFLLQTLEACHNEVTTELLILFRVSVLSRGLCNMLGVWMNPQQKAVFMVTQNPGKGEYVSAWEIIKKSFQSSELPGHSKRDDNLQSTSGRGDTSLSLSAKMTHLKLVEGLSHAQSFPSSAMKQIKLSKVGLELCAALWEVHSQGLIFGLLSPNCFVLDKFGSLLIDFNEVMSERSSLLDARLHFSGGSSDCVPDRGGLGSLNDFRGESDRPNDRNCCWRYMSPEALSRLGNNLAKAVDADRTTDVGNASSSSSCSHKVRSRLTCKTDVWSLGCLLLELVSGKAPYEGCTFPDVFQKVVVERESPGNFSGLVDSYIDSGGADCDAHVDGGKHIPEGSPIRSLATILSKCFEYDPDERPDLDILLWNLKQFEWPNVTSMRCSSPTGQHLQSEQAGKSDQKYWVLCLSGFVRDGYLDTGHGREDDAQESQIPVEISQRGSGAADDRRELQPSGLEPKGSLGGHRDFVTALAVCGDYLLSASFDKTIRVWSLEDNELRQTLEGHSIVVMALAVDHDSFRCFSGDTGGKICAWRIGEDTAEPLLATWQDHNDWRYSGVASLAVSTDGMLYSGSGDRTIKAWSLQNFSQLGTMEGHKGLVSALLVDRELLYSGSWDGTIGVWWRNDHTLIAVLGGGTTPTFALGSVRTLCMSDGFLFAGRDSGDIQVWRDEECLTTVKAHDTVVSSLYVEGDFLYTGSWDEKIKAWKVDTFLSNPAPALVKQCGLAVSSIVSDGDQLYAGLADRGIKVYSLLGDTWASLMQML